VMIAYFMLNIEIYLATYCVGVFRLSFGMWGPTELRVLLAIGTVAMFFRSYTKIAGREMLVADIGGIVAVLGMGIILVLSAVRNTARLYREERCP